MFEGAKLKEIGSVVVDSGDILIIDPCNADKPSAYVMINMAVETPTAWGDGAYHIFEVMQENALVGLFIDLRDGQKARIIPKTGLDGKTIEIDAIDKDGGL